MKIKHLLPTLLSIACIAAGWELAAQSIALPALFPPLTGLISEITRILLSNNFISEICSTIIRGLIGFTFALTLSLLLATVSSYSAFCYRFLHPILILLRSVPVISLVLMALLWFSPVQLPVFIALVTMFPILYQSILTGLKSTNPHFIEMARVFDKSRTNQFMHIVLPSAHNQIFDGMKTAMGFGWRAIIIGEVLAQPIHGIGTAMKQAQAYINVSELIAWTAIAVGISYLFEYAILAVQKIELERKLPKPDNESLVKKPKITNLQIVSIRNLHFSYNEKEIYSNFSYNFESGKIYCIKGESGRGKTSLLRIIAGLIQPNSGDVILPEKNKISYAFQDARLLPWYTVNENIAYALSGNTLTKQEVSNITYHLLMQLELSEHAHKYPHQLSGGQQQRVSLARAMAVNPDVLIMDEPLNGLDPELKIRIIHFLENWLIDTNTIVIWATHENISMKKLLVEEIYI